MKVKIKKVHPSWNYLHDNEFKVGDIVDIEMDIVTTKSGKKFNANDLTKAFSNHCTYFDIFDKVLMHHNDYFIKQS